MISIIDKTDNDDLIQDAVAFLINFHISSFNSECLSNFKLFMYEDFDLEDKLFKMLSNPQRSEDMKFLVCCLFLCVTVVEDVYKKLDFLNIVKPISRFIINYISKTFGKKFYKENDTKTNKRISRIGMLVKILYFISEEKNYKKIYHIDFFKSYFDIVLYLFQIYHPSFRIEILSAMNVFTYFYDCKQKVSNLDSKIINSSIFKRMENIFINLKRLYGIFTDSYENRSKLITQKMNINIVEYKNKFQENINIIEEIISNTKPLFYKSANEFGLLMSITVNAMLNNDFYSNFNKIFPEKSFFSDKKVKVKDENSLKFTLFDYDEFFKGIDLLKTDSKNNQNHQFEEINKYIRQIVVARLIYNPTGKLEYDNKRDNEEAEDNFEVNNLIYLYEMLKTYKADSDILHKVIYSINRFISLCRKPKLLLDNLKKIIDEVKVILYNEANSSIIVNRECLRFLCLITSFSENTLLWLKFDSKKAHVDFSNFSDVLLKYEDESTDWEPEDDQKERIIFPPYMKVKSYADKMGVIFYGSHVLILPKKLNLGNNFTIMFRFFNPVISTENWHVLLQDPSGLGGLICIDNMKKILGCFTEDGEFIDSGINLDDPEFKKKWIHITMSFRSRSDNEKSEQSRLDWYVNNTLTKSLTKKIILPKVVQYIGNSKDYSEPFGVFCDLRIYKNYLNQNQVGHIYLGEDHGKKDKNEYDLTYYIFWKAIDFIISNFLKSSDISEESFYFVIKFFNNILANRGYRPKFLNYYLIMKIGKYYNSKKMEIKKEISKFLQTTS